MTAEKTHYRKAFNSPYLSSADIVEPTVLTISHVALAKDETKKTRDMFNTAYFVEKELRAGEKLKPMILNATNSKAVMEMSGSPWIDDWKNIRVTVFVDHKVRFGRDTVDGLRLGYPKEKPFLTPENAINWKNAIEAYRRDGNLNKVLERVQLSEENHSLLLQQAEAPAAEVSTDE